MTICQKCFRNGPEAVRRWYKYNCEMCQEYVSQFDVHDASIDIYTTAFIDYDIDIDIRIPCPDCGMNLLSDDGNLTMLFQGDIVTLECGCTWHTSQAIKSFNYNEDYYAKYVYDICTATVKSMNDKFKYIMNDSEIQEMKNSILQMQDVAVVESFILTCNNIVMGTCYEMQEKVRINKDIFVSGS